MGHPRWFFWQLNCREGDEWNSAIYGHGHQRNYAGWWHQARYKWDGWTLHNILALHQTRQETLQSTLVKQKTGTLPKHKFEHWAGMETTLVNDGQQNDKLHYVFDVYVDAVISCIVPTTKRQVKHVAQTNHQTNQQTNQQKRTNKRTNK